MSTRAELESALATADAAWSKATQDLDQARAAAARASAQWHGATSGRRRKGAERRASNADRDASLPDQRKTQTDRRQASGAIAALGRAVAQRQEADVALHRAEVDRACAEVRVKAIEVERKRVVAALERLRLAELKAGDCGAAEKSRWSLHSLFQSRR